MLDTESNAIRRRPDGSIDTAHYIARGRRKRSEAARSLASDGALKSTSVLAACVAFIAFFPFLER